MVWKEQTEEEGRAFRDGAGTFHRTAEDGEVRDLPFADDGGIGKHHGILG